MAAYLLPFGWCVALVAKALNDDHSDFTVFHLRQGLGLNIIMLLCYVIIGKVVAIWALTQIVTLLLVLLMFVGIRGVRRNEMARQPLLGKLYERAFKFIK